MQYRTLFIVAAATILGMTYVTSDASARGFHRGFHAGGFRAGGFHAAGRRVVSGASIAVAYIAVESTAVESMAHIAGGVLASPRASVRQQ